MDPSASSEHDAPFKCTIDMGNNRTPSSQYASMMDGGSAAGGPDPTITIIINSETEFRVKQYDLIEKSRYVREHFEDPLTHNSAHGRLRQLFLPTDLTSFVHVLNYIEDGIFPQLWDTGLGYDEALHYRILLLAQQLLLSDLEQWMKTQSRPSATALSATSVVQAGQEVLGTNKQKYELVPTSRTVYHCPLRGATVLEMKNKPRYQTWHDYEKTMKHSWNNWNPWHQVPTNQWETVERKAIGYRKIWTYAEPWPQPPVMQNPSPSRSIWSP